jgi:PleD family two-component response regulator
MPQSILIVDEIASDREELARALEAEGFRVVISGSPSDAVRDIWEGTYIVVFIASVLTDTNPNALADQLRQMAPEVETIVYAKQDERSRLVRKAIAVRDGVAAA